MRFSIRSKGIKFEAEVGGTTILIRKTMWPLRLSSGQWHWTWLDGTQMVLAYNQQSYRDVRHELFADGKAVWQARVRVPLVFNSRWEEAKRPKPPV